MIDEARDEAVSTRPRRHRARVALVLVVVALAGVAAACVPPPPPPPPPSSIVVYGDSLTGQSQAAIHDRLASLLPGWNVEVRAGGGSAQCDFHETMKDDAAELDVKAVIIAFTGNYFTNCVQTLPVADAYTRDANWAVDFWRPKGVPLAFVIGPATVGKTPGEHIVGQVYEAVAALRDVPVIEESALFVDPVTGRYADPMPCMEGECTGTIRVRADDGVHLCNNDSSRPPWCGGYASGIARFAELIAHGAALLTGAPQPPDRTLVTTTTTSAPTTTTTAPSSTSTTSPSTSSTSTTSPSTSSTSTTSTSAP